MRTVLRLSLCGVTALMIGGVLATAQAAETRPPIDQRFATAATEEVPDFQQHVIPLFGKLGCNGRACHGSFQGQGGFRLSLFGYDFKADHEQLFDKDSPRVDLENPQESLIIVKPTDEDMHEGGQRYEKDTWQHHVITRWIESGAKNNEEPLLLEKLEIEPAEIVFKSSDQQVQLKAIAVWQDGTREDVTPLCRFQSNDDQVCGIDEGGLLTANQTGDTHVVITYDNAVVPVPVLRPITDLAGAKYPKVATPTKVDELVVEKLRKLGVVPSDLCSDAEFLRRVSLDMTGTLPSPGEVKEFLADKDPGKRAKKIDELLETPAYAAWWTTKLCDYTGNNDTQLNNASPMRGSATKEWYEWIYKRVENNAPYDELVEGIACASSIKPGQDYMDFCKEMSAIYHPDSDKSFADLEDMTYYWARQDFREIEARAIGFAYSFMGIRIQCAQCHKHPFDQWSKDDFHQFKNFFARVVAGRNGAPREFRDQYDQLISKLGLKDKRGNELRQMIPDLIKDGKTVPFPATYNSPTIQRTRNPMDEYPEFDHAKLLGGEVVDIKKVDEPRKVLMDWLRSPDNRFFAAAFVNRVWASYFNVGIVDPPDDLSLANPPSNKPLLDYLAKGFVDSGFDMKWVHRTIANSRTYQTSWQPNETNEADLRNFSHAIPRRLPAEVVYDAIQQATASDDKITELQADASGRAIAIPGSNYRNNRGGSATYALTVFGRSTRDTNCDCDRSSEPTLLQTVYLQNDSDLLQMIDARRDGWLASVTSELNPKKANADRFDPRRVQQFRKQFFAAQQQLKAAVKKDADKTLIARLQRRVDSMKEKLDEVSQPSEPEKVTVPTEKLQAVVNDAYLRSLSRYPKPEEMERSVAYLSEAGDTVEGVRDLLWALLNTKEFIVNH